MDCQGGRACRCGEQDAASAMNAHGPQSDGGMPAVDDRGPAGWRHRARALHQVGQSVVVAAERMMRSEQSVRIHARGRQRSLQGVMKLRCGAAALMGRMTCRP